MKKILAAVLATAMLSTVAMAANTGINTLDSGDTVNAGDKLFYVASDFKLDGKETVLAVDAYEFNEDYFNITTKKITKGGDLVKSVSFDTLDGVESLVVELKANSELTGIKKPNLTIEEIKIRAKKSSDTEGNFKARDLYEVLSKLNLKVVTAVDATYTEDTIDNIANVDGLHIADFVTAYEEGQLDGGDAYLYGRVYDEDKFLLSVTPKYNLDVIKAYAHTDANLSFVNVTMSGLATAWNIDLVADEDSYLYEVDEDGVLTEAKLEWNDDTYAFEGKIRGNMNFVVSDIELDVEDSNVEDDDTTTEEDDTNPNTGR